VLLIGELLGQEPVSSTVKCRVKNVGNCAWRLWTDATATVSAPPPGSAYWICPGADHAIWVAPF
jgi:hypothetical protein